MYDDLSKWNANAILIKNEFYLPIHIALCLELLLFLALRDKSQSHAVCAKCDHATIIWSVNDCGDLLSNKGEIALDNLLDALEADHDYLTAGGVFPEELLQNFIKTKREECRRMAAIPHPAEFEQYYNL